MKHKLLITTIIFLLLFSCSNNSKFKEKLVVKCPQVELTNILFNSHYPITHVIHNYVTKDFIHVYDTIFDARDSNYYEAVLIGDTWWMTENLRYKPNDSLDIIQGEGNYNNIYYGDVENICPEGWTIPTENDWKNMLNFYQINYAFGAFNYPKGDIPYVVYDIKVLPQKRLNIIERNNLTRNGFSLDYDGFIQIKQGKPMFYRFGEVSIYGFKDKNGEILNIKFMKHPGDAIYGVEKVDERLQKLFEDSFKEAISGTFPFYNSKYKLIRCVKKQRSKI